MDIMNMLNSMDNIINHTMIQQDIILIPTFNHTQPIFIRMDIIEFTQLNHKVFAVWMLILSLVKEITDLDLLRILMDIHVTCVSQIFPTLSTTLDSIHRSSTCPMSWLLETQLSIHHLSIEVIILTHTSEHQIINIPWILQVIMMMNTLLMEDSQLICQHYLNMLNLSQLRILNSQCHQLIS